MKLGSTALHIPKPAVPCEERNSRSNRRKGTPVSLSERPDAAGMGAAGVQPQQRPGGWRGKDPTAAPPGLTRSCAWSRHHPSRQGNDDCPGERPQTPVTAGHSQAPGWARCREPRCPLCAGAAPPRDSSPARPRPVKPPARPVPAGGPAPGEGQSAVSGERGGRRCAS